jgi:hypothetical protein
VKLLLPAHGDNIDPIVWKEFVDSIR